MLLPDDSSPFKTRIGYGPTGRSRRRQPGHHEAEIRLREIDVRPQQVDRAVAGRHGQPQKSPGAAKVDAGTIGTFLL